MREIRDDGFAIFESGRLSRLLRRLRGCAAGARHRRALVFRKLTVDDVDAYHARAIAHGVEIVKALAGEPWGTREFGLRTIDGQR
ncbi:MAG: VOC family protein, partial [Myxococcales bacterium]|nr:VOC family protein [Myxococcales bacterium]